VELKIDQSRARLERGYCGNGGHGGFRILVVPHGIARSVRSQFEGAGGAADDLLHHPKSVASSCAVADTALNGCAKGLRRRARPNPSLCQGGGDSLTQVKDGNGDPLLRFVVLGHYITSGIGRVGLVLRVEENVVGDFIESQLKSL